MEEKEREREERKNRRQNGYYNNTQVAPIEKFQLSFGSRYAWNSGNREKLPLVSAYSKLRQTKLKHWEWPEGSRAKYEAERVYLCDSVVITRSARLWFPKVNGRSFDTFDSVIEYV